MDEALGEEGGASFDFQAIDRLGRHPRLPEAVAAMASGMLAVAEAEQELDTVFKDGGRYFGAMAAFHLHESEGLTLPRLKALCARSGMLSPGRARLLLELLAHHDLLAPGGGAWPRRYLFRERFVAGWLAHLETALRAALPLEPALEDLVGRLDRGRLRAFGHAHAGAYVKIMDGRTDVGPELSVVTAFLHAYAGSQILWVLLANSRDGAFPPVVAGPVSFQALANRFGVSRIHVRRLFDRAKAQGLVRLDGEGLVHFSEDAQAQLRFIWAAQFFQILQAAAAVMRADEIGGEGRLG